MAERIDRKYDIHATSTEHGKIRTHNDAVLFLAQDKALPDTLRYYRAACMDLEVDEKQLKGIDLLISRVEDYQSQHPTKIPDIDDTPEGDAIVAPNEPMEPPRCENHGVVGCVYCGKP